MLLVLALEKRKVSASTIKKDNSLNKEVILLI